MLVNHKRIRRFISTQYNGLFDPQFLEKIMMKL